jgi:hypothetical protein
MNRRRTIILGVSAALLLAAACDAGSRLSPVANGARPSGALRHLSPLRITAPLPAGAQVEDRTQPGMPRRVNVTSIEPELIFDLEEVDPLSPGHAEVLALATRPSTPSERLDLRKNERGPDGSFQVLVVHHTSSPGVGQLEAFTVDTRVRAGERLYDCSGTASSDEAAQRLLAACTSVRAD